MKVILIKEVDNLGGAHELVDVRPGYARNYLIPQKYAIEASKTNLKQLEERQKVFAKREAELLAQFNKVSDVLKESNLKVSAKISESGRIFGSVTTVQIARNIREQKGYEIDRRKIQILDEVKEPGTYNAQLDFGSGRSVDFQFEVVAE